MRILKILLIGIAVPYVTYCVGYVTLLFVVTGTLKFTIVPPGERITSLTNAQAYHRCTMDMYDFYEKVQAKIDKCNDLIEQQGDLPACAAK